MDDSLLLDFDSPNSDDVRFSAAFGAWYRAAMESQQALANPNVPTLLGALPGEFGCAVDLDLAWRTTDGDAYRQVRDTSPAGPMLDALARARTLWTLPTVLYLVDLETTDPAESLRFRPVQELGPVLDEDAVGLYTDHLQGRTVGEIGRTLTDLFMRNPQAHAGRAGAIVRMMMPSDRGDDPNRKARSQGELMATQHPDLVEAEQRAQGLRHLTIIHGAPEGEMPPHEVLSLKMLLEVFRSQPPQYYIGLGQDRTVLIVGGPRAGRTITTLEGLARVIAPKTKGGGMADPDWEFVRGFVPGEQPPDTYITNDTDDEDTTTDAD